MRASTSEELSWWFWNFDFAVSPSHTQSIKNRIALLQPGYPPIQHLRRSSQIPLRAVKQQVCAEGPKPMFKLVLCEPSPKPCLRRNCRKCGRCLCQPYRCYRCSLAALCDTSRSLCGSNSSIPKPPTDQTEGQPNRKKYNSRIHSSLTLIIGAKNPIQIKNKFIGSLDRLFEIDQLH